MDTVTHLKLKHLHNPNKYGLAMWNAKNVSLSERFQALCGITMEEFKEPANQILKSFNTRNAAMFTKLCDVPSHFVTLEDLVVMDIMYDKLQFAVNALEANHNLLLSTISALDTLSPAQIMRVTINTLVYEKTYGGMEEKPKKCPHYMLEHVPTKEEIQSLGLSPENQAHAEEFFY